MAVGPLETLSYTSCIKLYRLWSISFILDYWSLLSTLQMWHACMDEFELTNFSYH